MVWLKRLKTQHNGMVHVRNLHWEIYDMKPDKGYLLLNRVRFMLHCEYAESQVTIKEESPVTRQEELPDTKQE